MISVIAYDIDHKILEIHSFENQHSLDTHERNSIARFKQVAEENNTVFDSIEICDHLEELVNLGKKTELIGE